MEDFEKPREQLIAELAGLRRRLAALEAGSRPAPVELEPPSSLARLPHWADMAQPQRELLLETLVQHAADISAVLGLDGVVYYQSPSVEAVLGYGPAELAGRDLWEFIHPEDRERLRALLTGPVRPPGQARGFECRFRHAGGGWVHLEVTGSRLPAGSALPGIVVNARDITDRKQAQVALARSEERFRQVVVSISAHIYVTEVTPNGRHINLYLSPHVVAMTGYPLDRFISDWSFWPSVVIHPDDRVLAALQASQLALGQSSEVEYRLIRADGQVLWVRDSARVESDGASRIIYGLVSDITGRRRAEEEIRKLNEELEQRVADRTRELSALYDVTAVASEALDLQTTLERSLERVLAAMRSRMGAIYLLDEAEPVLRLAVYQGLAPDLAAQMKTMSLGTGLGGWVMEHSEPLLVPDVLTDPRATAAIREAGLHTYLGVPMRARGRTLGVLSVFGRFEQQFTVEEMALLASIADHVAVAVENGRLRQQAERAAVMEERQRLARELHDSVTQSLYSLTLFAEAGWKQAGAGEVEGLTYYFTRIRDTAQQALKEMRLLVHELRPLNLARQGLVGALHRRLGAVERRANVKARLVAEQLVKLPAPVEEELYRIAQEALNNALKHAGAETVTIYLRAEGGQGELEVLDDGVGFDAGGVSDAGGMGLLTMQERAARLGGTLTVSSEPGAGTRVKVTFAVPAVG